MLGGRSKGVTDACSKNESQAAIDLLEQTLLLPLFPGSLSHYPSNQILDR